MTVKSFSSLVISGFDNMVHHCLHYMGTADINDCYFFTVHFLYFSFKLNKQHVIYFILN